MGDHRLPGTADYGSVLHPMNRAAHRKGGTVMVIRSVTSERHIFDAYIGMVGYR